MRSAARLARRAVRRPSRRGRCSRASPRTPCCRSSSPATAAFGLVLRMLGHAVGWPVAARRLAGDRRRAGVAVCARSAARSRPAAPVTLAGRAAAARGPCCSTSRRARCSSIAGDALPGRYRRGARAASATGRASSRSTTRSSGPVPWAAEPCRRAGTVHVGGTLEEIAASEADGRGRPPRRAAVRAGRPAEPVRPDPRARRAQHTLWAYCHVPNGSDVDMTEAIERQIERFAPGFRDVVAGAPHDGPGARSRPHNPNYVGGDINGGARRPAPAPGPAGAAARSRTRRPTRASSCARRRRPPGGGVHGMCGWLAARAALRGVLR